MARQGRGYTVGHHIPGIRRGEAQPIRAIRNAYRAAVTVREVPPVKTLASMTPEERAALEKQYNAKIL